MWCYNTNSKFYQLVYCYNIDTTTTIGFMSDLTQASNPAQTGADDNNNKSDGSTGTTKSKSAIKRDKRRKAQARAHASHDLANTTVNKPTLSTFVGQDPDLASLDYTADVAVHYGHFKKEISRYASTIHPLLGTVIDSGDEQKAQYYCEQAYSIYLCWSGS